MPPKRGGWGGGGGGFGVAPGAEAVFDAKIAREVMQRNPRQQQPQRAPQPQATSLPLKDAFDAYVVLDFEATCEENVRLRDPEVIEFPFVIVDPQTCSIATEFQRFVRPQRRPTLTPFCTRLTGITQAQVDHAAPFSEVLDEVKAFLAAAHLGDASPSRSYCVVTCGDWDLGTMLPTQLDLSGLSAADTVPRAWGQWCNLKKFLRRPGLGLPGGKTARITGMPDMLSLFNLPLVGHHHSGIDDCRNIASVVCEILRRGIAVQPTNLPPGQPPCWWRCPQGLHPPLSSVPSSLAPGIAAASAAAAVAPTAAAPPQSGRTPGTAAAAQPRAVLPALAYDDSEDPAAAAASDGGAPLPKKALTDISHAASKILRHSALQSGVPITANGFVKVSDLLRARDVRRHKPTLADLLQVVRLDAKQRYRVVRGAADGELYIRANQGHSMPGVSVEMRPITVAVAAVHGTFYTAWAEIERCGYLSPMNRQHIHCAKGLVGDAGVISGMRRTVEVYVYLDVPKMLADGVPLFESDNGVILTPGVGDTRQLPLAYVEKVVDRQTGDMIFPKK